eukprot:m.300770 g.300770  ORF g.300770 m.300770 type:complete len:121 (+) comp125603_c0_seq1:27-389(+)
MPSSTTLIGALDVVLSWHHPITFMRHMALGHHTLCYRGAENAMVRGVRLLARLTEMLVVVGRCFRSEICPTMTACLRATCLHVVCPLVLISWHALQSDLDGLRWRCLDLTCQHGCFFLLH